MPLLLFQNSHIRHFTFKDKKPAKLFDLETRTIFPSGSGLWPDAGHTIHRRYCTGWSTLSAFPPSSHWRGVVVGRSEPNSVPLLLLFQGGRRCEPLKQQEEQTGAPSHSDSSLTIDEHNNTCCAAQKMAAVKCYSNMSDSPDCTFYSLAWMYEHPKMCT